ncbi:MAG: Ig-like domain-containing protein [Nanoarchaeota archaeon]
MDNNKKYITITIIIIFLAIFFLFLNNNLTSDVIKQTDIIAPTISITSPQNNYFSEKTYLTIKGIASDNVGIREIRFKSNDNNWEIIAGSSSWSKGINLNQGENIIYVQAFDKNGNASPVESIRIYA